MSNPGRNWSRSTARGTWCAATCVNREPGNDDRRRNKRKRLSSDPPNDVILEVDSLKMYFPITRGLLKKQGGRDQGRRRRVVQVEEGRDPRPRRRERLWQDHRGALHLPAVQADSGAHLVRGQRHLHDAREGVQASSPRDRRHIPGSLRLAGSPADGREHRGRAAQDPQDGREQGRLRREGGAPVRQGGLGPGSHVALSPRVQRGPAAAHRHRPGSGRRSQPDHLRRAGLGAGRVHPGPDHQPPHGSAKRGCPGSPTSSSRTISRSSSTSATGSR